jgi:hypothetical protein
MNPNTATRQEIIRYIVAQTSQENIEEWAERWLNALSGNELREWVRDALPEPEPEPLPPTRQLTDTERAVLRGMLP